MIVCSLNGETMLQSADKPLAVGLELVLLLDLYLALVE
jgi:hypothetical protein